MFDPNRKADVLLTVEVSPSPVKRSTANPPDNAAAQPPEKLFFGVSQPRDSLACLLLVLAVPRWMAGLWQDDILTGSVFSEVPGGWFNHRSGVPVFLSFVDARQWIDERIAELGLDADLVNAWPKSKHSFEWDREFYALPFEERMDIFRARK